VSELGRVGPGRSDAPAGGFDHFAAQRPATCT
jgi:hypothetical protein